MMRALTNRKSIFPNPLTRATKRHIGGAEMRLYVCASLLIEFLDDDDGPRTSFPVMGFESRMLSSLGRAGVRSYYKRRS